MRVVERWAAHTHGHIGPASIRGVRCDDRSVGPPDLECVLIVDLITDEVRSRVGLGEGIFRALQFRLHRCEEDAGIGFPTRRTPAERSARDNDGD